MCIRDRGVIGDVAATSGVDTLARVRFIPATVTGVDGNPTAVSYTHLRAHETVLDLVCRLLLEKKKKLQHTPIFTTYTHHLK